MRPLHLVGHIGHAGACVASNAGGKGHVAAQLVFLRIGVVVRLHIRNHGRAKSGQWRTHQLQHNAVVLKNRQHGPGLYCRCGAVDVQRVGMHGLAALCHHQSACLDGLHAAHANDLGNAAQLRYLAHRDGGVVKHGGRVLRVNAQHLSAGL